MALPVLLSLTAEPLTGLVDTAFVARLGTESLAALGVGAVALSSVFWVFGFLGVGTQTEVAQAMGQRDRGRAARFASLAVTMGVGTGVLLILLGFPFLTAAARLMGAEGSVQDQAVVYMQGRLWGAPAILATVALLWVWLVTAGWIGVRAVLGVVRIWPGVGRAPLRRVAVLSSNT